MEITDSIRKFLKLRLKVSCEGKNWPEMVEVVEKHRPSFSFKIVRWIHPPVRWFKCNTNGASRGNPGSSAFCLRDSKGDFVVAKGVRIQDTTNLVVEARAIIEGLSYCRDNYINDVIIESDSMALVHILEGSWEIPWEWINGGGLY
ncbi:hypothetical protein KY290_021537 [Solanum tuberosum]|uniref:RNase H type-1 domain-containing protein n=1 Tax=Solanum tuberosum TaxID=4113 RepID=A0ABQ7V1V3_SOLTU|nr:hypothetical protein KY289_020701 [Solanum tuberosum]KAH0758044.1 hypothetical protein KY290_021537 [Solanum tuberosum]